MLVTLYRLEDSRGYGPIIIAEKIKHVANPRGMDNGVLFSEGDDLFKFKYACTSPEYLEMYFGKKFMEKALKTGFKITVKEIPENLIRYAGTRKVVAYKFTDKEMFPHPETLKVIGHDKRGLKMVRSYKNTMLKAYYKEGLHKKTMYQGQFGFLRFCEDVRQGNFAVA